MIVEQTAIAGVEPMGPESHGFRASLRELLGEEPNGALQSAVPCSIIVRNNASRSVALLGVRFDMTAETGRTYSVVHYADTLRNPEKAVLKPGAARFVCAEAAWTQMALDWQSGRRICDQRARMNLDILRQAREIRASLDCVAFGDGEFAGPDSLGAFKRFRAERQAESIFLKNIAGILNQPPDRIENTLARAMAVPRSAAKTVARQLHAAWLAGGAAELGARVGEYRFRMELWR